MHPLPGDSSALRTAEPGARPLPGAINPIAWRRVAHGGIVRRGKIWYVCGDGWVLTVKAGSCTVIAGRKIGSTRV